MMGILYAIGIGTGAVAVGLMALLALSWGVEHVSLLVTQMRYESVRRSFLADCESIARWNCHHFPVVADVMDEMKSHWESDCQVDAGKLRSKLCQKYGKDEYEKNTEEGEE